jgi:transcriptional regulator with XRE-family HTH domain
MPTANTELLRERRLRLGLSLDVLADRCRLTSIGLIGIETGRHNPSIEVCQRLATQLCLSPEAIAPGLVAPSDARTIRERRQAIGKKVSELAREVGISRQHLSNVEAGIKHPSPDLLAALARVLGCQPSELADAA